MRAILFLLAVVCLLSVSVQGQSGVTFCEKYTALLFINGTDVNNQKTLITAVVTRAVTGVTQGSNDGFGIALNNVTGLFRSSLQLAIFNGTVKYKTNPPNYTTNTTALAGLANKLVAFFGNAFGCRAAGYPTYTPPADANTQALIHKNMGINKAIMNDFITILATTLTSFGVSSADVSGTAAPFLQSFNRCAGNNEICNASDCDQAPSTTCPTGGNANSNYVTSWAVVAFSWILFFVARKNL